MIGVTGWYSAKPRNQWGIVSAGTKAVLTYGKNIKTMVMRLADSGPLATTPKAAASQDSARTKKMITARAANQSTSEPVGRHPTSTPAPITNVVAKRLRETLAPTCPISSEPDAIGIERKRSTSPLDISCATAAEVVPAPKPAHKTMIPGTT